MLTNRSSRNSIELLTSGSFISEDISTKLWTNISWSCLSYKNDKKSLEQYVWLCKSYVSSIHVRSNMEMRLSGQLFHVLSGNVFYQCGSFFVKWETTDLYITPTPLRTFFATDFLVILSENDVGCFRSVRKVSLEEQTHSQSNITTRISIVNEASLMLFHQCYWFNFW